MQVDQNDYWVWVYTFLGQCTDQFDLRWYTKQKMFALGEARLESYLESFRVLMEELGEVDPRDTEAFRIDFDSIWTTLHTASRMELGLLLARVAANHPINNAWAEDDLQTLKIFLEERLHTVEWLDEVKAAPNPMLVTYLHTVLLDQLCGNVRVNPVQLTPEHIAGQLRALMETPPDNMTKTLEAMETMHRSRVWLETMTPAKLLIYKTTPQDIAFAIEQLEIALSVAGNHLEAELAIPDQELARKLQAEEESNRKRAPAQPTVAERLEAAAIATIAEREAAGAKETDYHNYMKEFQEAYKNANNNPWKLPHSALAPKRTRIPSRLPLDPTQWKRMVSLCSCCICSSLQLPGRVQRATHRLCTWGFPMHIRLEVCTEILGRYPGSRAWENRDFLWLTINRDYVKVVFALFIDVPDHEASVVYKVWLAEKLDTLHYINSEGAMLVALLWAGVESADERDCFSISEVSWLAKYSRHFKMLRDNEGYS